MTDCEFKKECDEAIEEVSGFKIPSEIPEGYCSRFVDMSVCQDRKFAILVVNGTLRDVLAEQIVVSSGLPVVPTLPIEALKMEEE